MTTARKFIKATGLAISVIIIASAFLGCSNQEEKTIDLKNIQLSEEQKSEVSKDIDSGLKEKSFSGTAYAGLNSQDIFLNSYGFSDNGKKEKIKNNKSYQLGSVTKIFTGLSIMKLESEGKLKASDTLDKYFSGYNYLKKITIKNLLDMTSGFGSYLKDISNDKELYNKINKKVKKNPNSIKVNKDITKYVLKKGTEYETGEYHYSNSGYFLLGKIISRFSDNGFSGYINDNFIKPLKLKNTGFLYNSADIWGYNEKTGKWRKPASIPFLNDTSVMYSSMGMTSSAEDLNKVIDAVLNNKIAKKTNCINKITSGKTKFNYGFYIDRNILYAEGATTLHTAYIFVDTEFSAKSVALSNHTNINSFEETAKVSYNAIKSKINGILIENT